MWGVVLVCMYTVLCLHCTPISVFVMIFCCILSCAYLIVDMYLTIARAGWINTMLSSFLYIDLE